MPVSLATSTIGRRVLPAIARSTTRYALAWLGVTVIFGFTLILPRDAAACWPCTANSGCPTGFECAGTICLPSNTCQVDRDCAQGMRCLLMTETECIGSGASDCSRVNSCAPVWQGGCNVDADCGPGFQCGGVGSSCVVECSGTGEPCGGCTCVQSQQVACTADTDCPPCWSCTSATAGCINAGGPAFPVDAGTPPKVCRPPYWGLTSDYVGFAPQAGSTPPTLDGVCSGTTPLGTTPPPNTGGTGGGGCAIETAGGAGTSAWLIGMLAAGLFTSHVKRRRRSSRA